MRPDLIGGRYRIDHAVGRGGMGTVWLARDELLRRDVAVKQVGLLPGQSDTDSARALREARSAAGLGHRNVVTVFDVVEERDAIWLVMEYVEGRSLSQIVAAEGPLDPARVADIGAQVADGLAAAHAVGTIHRDVKPGNVLVRADGLAQISDFGIARSPGDPRLTQSGLLTGTPTYFSPELARGAAPSPAADVWALGATLYAAVEGHPPYRSQENPVALLHDIVTTRPPAPDRAGFLEPVLQRLLDRDPVSRWTMPDAAHALHRLASEHAPERTRAETLRDIPAGPPARPAEAAAPERTGRGAGGSGRLDPSSTAVARAIGPVEGPAAESRDRSDPLPGSSAPGGSRPSGSPPRGSPPPGSSPAGSSPAGSSPAGRSVGGRAGYALAALVLLLLVGGGVGYLLVHTGGDGSADHGGGTAAGVRSRSATSTPTSGPSGSGSADSGGTGSSGTGSSGTGSTGTGSAGATPSESADGTSQAAFLQRYFTLAPGGTDAAWRQLGPGEQAQGRSRYDSFWRGISSVTVSDVRAEAGSDKVEATLTYRRTDGVTSTERHRLTLVRSGDGYLIDADVPAG
jgi:serine/threonine protein kinase